MREQKQINLIVNWFRGVPLDRDYTPDEFNGIWAEVWRELLHWDQPQDGDWQEGAKNYDWYSEMRDAVSNYVSSKYRGGSAAWDTIARLIDNPPVYLSLYDLAATLPPITWLWENWLPTGMISLLAARPGTGKSLVALDLCRRVIAGEAWPDGSAGTAAGRCIYVDAENVPAILNQRAQQWEAWGMDRRRLYPVIPERDQDIVNLGDEMYRDLLWNMAYRLRPGLIVIDSLRDILPAGESAVEDIRSTLAYLSHLATEHHTAVLIIHHLRKSQNSGQIALFDSIDLDQVSGSGYIGGRSRVVAGLTKIQVGPKPDKNGPRKLEVIKTNLGVYPPDLGITFDQIPPDGLKLTWTDHAPERYQEPTERDEAGEWLLEYLADAGDAVPPKTVIAAAQDAGFSRAMVYRARESLRDKIASSRGRRHPDNGWKLAGTDDGAIES